MEIPAFRTLYQSFLGQRFFFVGDDDNDGRREALRCTYRRLQPFQRGVFVQTTPQHRGFWQAFIPDSNISTDVDFKGFHQAWSLQKELAGPYHYHDAYLLSEIKEEEIINARFTFILDDDNIYTDSMIHEMFRHGRGLRTTVIFSLNFETLLQNRLLQFDGRIIHFIHYMFFWIPSRGWSEQEWESFSLCNILVKKSKMLFDQVHELDRCGALIRGGNGITSYWIRSLEPHYRWRSLVRGLQAKRLLYVANDGLDIFPFHVWLKLQRYLDRETSVRLEIALA